MEWDRRRKRLYGALVSGLSWNSRYYGSGGNVRLSFITLTSSPQSDFNKLNYNFQKLVKIIRRKVRS